MTLFEARRGPYYDPWEAATEAARARAMRRRLDDYLRLARTLPFYQGRLEAYDPAGEHPLAGVPPLTPAELRELVPPTSRRLLSSRAPGFNVFQSGGTTGFPKTAVFASEEVDALDLPNARGFYAVGLTPRDRVCNLFAAGSLYMTFIHINRMLQNYGCMNFPLSNHAPADFIRMVARLFKTNCVAGITSVVLNALRGLESLGLEGIRVEKVFYGGEHIYEADKEWLRRRFGARVVAAPGYGTIDTWYIGYQCARTPTGVFHCHDDQCWLEIADEETGRPCGPGQAGMVHATPFPRRLTPLVRYRVGDRAAWVGKPCPCGRTTPLFRLMGRGDDVLRIGFDSIDYASVQECVAAVGRLSGSVQIRKERDRGRDRLIVAVESSAPRTAHGRLKAALNARILSARPTTRKAVAAGAVHPLRIDILPPGSIPRNPRTGKLVRVKDAL